MKTKYLKNYIRFGDESLHRNLCLFLSKSLDKDGINIVVSANLRFFRGYGNRRWVSSGVLWQHREGESAENPKGFSARSFLTETPLGSREDFPGWTAKRFSNAAKEFFYEKNSKLDRFGGLAAYSKGPKP